jgi:hypothetical protein
MEARVLIETLHHRGINITVFGDKVRIDAPREPDPDTKALLQELKEHKEAVKSYLAKPDPMLSVEDWYSHFLKFCRQVYAETPDFDCLWLKENRADLYRVIKAKENEIDALGGARLSEVMAVLREWRSLILKAEFVRKESPR